MPARTELTFPVLQRLFTSFTAGAFQLPNRMVMAPMTRNRAAAGNVPSPLMATYYRQRATAGLIVTEGTQVSPEGVGYPNTPGIHTDEQVAGWRRIVNDVHGAGGRIVLQLWHVGRISHPSLQPEGERPVAPSAIKPDGQAFTFQGLQPFTTPRALESREIERLVRQFAAGARRAKEAGFDGVELHGANGYLIDQFLRDGTNHRTDQYGGSLVNRLRFLLEVTEAVVEVWGEGRVGVRLSPTSSFNDMRDSDPVRTFSAAAEALNSRRLAYLHVIEASPESTTFDPTAARTLPSISQAFHGPLIVNDGYTADTAEATLLRGEADLVSFGASFLANPDLVERFRRGLPLNTPDRSTFYGGDARGYTDYPEYELVSNPAAAA
jgi:N-ethylmaleimide reductase